MGNTFAVIEKLLTGPLCIEWPKFCPHPWNYCSLCCTARYRFMGEGKEKVKQECRGACRCVTDWNLNSVLLACKYKRRSSGIWSVFTFSWFTGNGTIKIHTLTTFFPSSIQTKILFSWSPEVIHPKLHWRMNSARSTRASPLVLHLFACYRLCFSRSVCFRTAHKPQKLSVIRGCPFLGIYFLWCRSALPLGSPPVSTRRCSIGLHETSSRLLVHNSPFCVMWLRVLQSGKSFSINPVY